jgi:hypothetical protein
MNDVDLVRRPKRTLEDFINPSYFASPQVDFQIELLHDPSFILSHLSPSTSLDEQKKQLKKSLDFLLDHRKNEPESQKAMHIDSALKVLTHELLSLSHKEYDVNLVNSVFDLFIFFKQTDFYTPFSEYNLEKKQKSFSEVHAEKMQEFISCMLENCEVKVNELVTKIFPEISEEFPLDSFLQGVKNEKLGSINLSKLSSTFVFPSFYSDGDFFIKKDRSQYMIQESSYLIHTRENPMGSITSCFLPKSLGVFTNGEAGLLITQNDISPKEAYTSLLKNVMLRCGLVKEDPRYVEDIFRRTLLSCSMEQHSDDSIYLFDSKRSLIDPENIAKRGFENVQFREKKIVKKISSFYMKSQIMLGSYSGNSPITVLHGDLVSENIGEYRIFDPSPMVGPSFYNLSTVNSTNYSKTLTISYTMRDFFNDEYKLKLEKRSNNLSIEDTSLFLGISAYSKWYRQATFFAQLGDMKNVEKYLFLAKTHFDLVEDILLGN